MKKAKRVLAIILVMALTISVGTMSAFASPEPDIAKHYVGLRAGCSVCGMLAFVTCMQEMNYYGTGTHGKCEYDAYTSNAAYICDYGHEVDYGGEHLCWELHDTCSKGNYDVCFCEIS